MTFINGLNLWNYIIDIWKKKRQNHDWKSITIMWQKSVSETLTSGLSFLLWTWIRTEVRNGVIKNSWFGIFSKRMPFCACRFQLFGNYRQKWQSIKNIHDKTAFCGFRKIVQNIWVGVFGKVVQLSHYDNVFEQTNRNSFSSNVQTVKTIFRVFRWCSVLCALLFNLYIRDQLFWQNLRNDLDLQLCGRQRPRVLPSILWRTNVKWK